mmetsp:Transcript_46958/g.69512  ORF Transcript_46958/g.69512 Transcript_46958/m.69512 type:complete len:203 (-) Transcript_46958:439-1047(-)
MAARDALGESFALRKVLMRVCRSTLLLGLVFAGIAGFRLLLGAGGGGFFLAPAGLGGCGLEPPPASGVSAVDARLISAMMCGAIWGSRSSLFLIPFFFRRSFQTFGSECTSMPPVASRTTVRLTEWISILSSCAESFFPLPPNAVVMDFHILRKTFLSFLFSSVITFTFVVFATLLAWLATADRMLLDILSQHFLSGNANPK